VVITEKFVYIHMPKTGGTFVTSVLRRIHNNLDHTASSRFDSTPWPVRSVLRRLTRWSASSTNPYGLIADLEPKHGTCHEIPEPHRSKPILSTVRNPFDWYVSQYEFGWWKRTFSYHPESHPTPAGFAIERVLPEFIETHPHFPELSFAEFVELCCAAALVFNSEFGAELGLYTHSYLQFYSRDVSELIPHMHPDYVGSGRHKSHMFNVHFLRTNRLNQDLYDYLLAVGYLPQDLRFIAPLGKILPMGIGRRDDQKWENYYTPSLKAFIRAKEWAVFDMFPERL
jgi:hypothetical protein